MYTVYAICLPLSDDEIRYLHYCDYTFFSSFLHFVGATTPVAAAAAAAAAVLLCYCVLVHELYAERQNIATQPTPIEIDVY